MSRALERGRFCSIQPCGATLKYYSVPPFANTGAGEEKLWQIGKVGKNLFDGMTALDHLQALQQSEVLECNECLHRLVCMIDPAAEQIFKSK